jgi:hypothetical protein
MPSFIKRPEGLVLVMKNSDPKFLLILLICSFLPFPGLAQKKCVFIIVDGIPADVIERVETPNLRAIAKEGGYARAHVGGGKGTYSQSPTISAVGYNHVLTGVWSNKHNVWGNDIKAPIYFYPSVFRLLKMQRPKANTAIFSTWTDNRTKLVGEGMPETGYFKFDEVFDGYELDKEQYPAKDPLRISKIDERVAAGAAIIIRETGPDLSWVYLEFTDDMGHQFGDSKELNDAVKKADAQVGDIWNAVKARQQSGEEWMVVVTTDHGRSAIDGKGHGSQSDRERTTWITTNAKNLNEQFKGGDLAAVDILPSITRFLGIAVPEPISQEWDGVPFIGPLSVTNLTAEKRDATIRLTWKHLGEEEPLSILMSTTNNFKNGQPDSFQPVATVSSSKDEFILRSLPTSDFYKFVVKGKHNTLNVWVK